MIGRSYPGLIAATFCLIACVGCLIAEDELKIGDEIFELQPFVIYETPIDVIDGFTGEKYSGNDPIVLDFADSFNDLLLGYHKHLLTYEIKHLDFRLRDGVAFENDLAKLLESFGYKGFKIDHNQWLIKEKAILYRLNEEPFYKIDALIAWDEDELERMRRSGILPKNKYARDIHYNESKGIWERRVTTEWKVSYRTLNKKGYLGNPVNILKEQGLNLDTNEGFHIIDRGLTNQVIPAAFRDVNLTYPIIINSREPREEQVRRLQETFVSNLVHIYDPFSWVARRDTRFRGGFTREVNEFVGRKRLPVTDRKWFEPVFSKLLSDIVTIQHQGTKEIYSLYTLQRFHLSNNILGEGLDLLNWNPGEKRKGEAPNTDAKVFISFKNPNGARFIVLDTYMRYSDKFVEALRTNMAAMEKKKGSGMEMMIQTIEEVTGAPFEKYEKIAIKAQKEMIEKYR
ncbi:MAG: hypothetical protein KJT03_03665 [Verrucomicrobiae bacterium]|nr:hypothetical protein [Verrucomicrobiae bacterium]